MKLVLQRYNGDCGICALATLLERPYEDVFVEFAKIDRKTRGKNGSSLKDIIATSGRMGMPMRYRRKANVAGVGLLFVKWEEGSRHTSDVGHLVALSHGIVADPADGVVLPVNEYLQREKARVCGLLELK